MSLEFVSKRVLNTRLSFKLNIENTLYEFDVLFESCNFLYKFWCISKSIK